MGDLFSDNKKTNKNIAMVLLFILWAQGIGLTAKLGFDLANLPGYQAIGLIILWLLNLVGLGWIMVGLWKREIGV